MTWYAWPALAFVIVFILVLIPPRRRFSHYSTALILAGIAGCVVAVLTLTVWGITR